MANNFKKRKPSEFEEKVVRISRVSKKTKGGNNVGFSTLIVIGDRKGRVGVGLGKATDVLSSIRKATKKAKKKMITVPMDGTTIPFEVRSKCGAGKVIIKPASKGTGIIAGGPVRAVMEVAGYRDISAKILGSSNQASSVYATFEALKQIAKIVKVRGISLRSIAEIEEEERKKVKELNEKARESKAAAKVERQGKKKSVGKVKTGEVKKVVKKAVKVDGVKKAKVKKSNSAPVKTTVSKKIVKSEKK